MSHYLKVICVERIEKVYFLNAKIKSEPENVESRYFSGALFLCDVAPKSFSGGLWGMK
ncbi:hypothetical protein C942_00414 [Photobacterium marinum]|uniref:Uncharacterized protein n=1 Tax=Photobacterium marinum TaxID=1056511 RepID=L8JB99_9GAMM|nr:hypothetical protein C942_00414 [Photobacterium marinum]